MAKQIYSNYGVIMNGLESMYFSDYIKTLQYGMNTISKSERYDIAKNWLKEKRSKCATIK